MEQETAGNHIEHLHDESYERGYDPRNLNRTTMIQTTGRTAESLNGLWRFTIDPYDTGLRMGWHDPGQHGVAAPWDYDPDGGEGIPVPSCWNMHRPEYLHYEGSAWYARRFAYRAAPPGERVFLRIGAANYDAKVFLNHAFLGNHRGGSTPFCLELTGGLRVENLLQICVNDARTLDRVPMRNTDWFNYGGIYRDIGLFRLPASFIRDFKVQLVPDGTYGRIKFEMAVDGPASDGEARVEIPELQIAAWMRIEGGRGELTVAARPERWSPDTPRLYSVSAAYGGDRVEERVGFRQIGTAGTDILLNGKRIFLRGVCVHEDDAQCGKVSDEADIRRRFAHAKELGCNFLRLAHYPHTELAASIADEVGLMLWEEIPVYWAIDFTNQSTYADAENQLLELIKRDQNRVSVIIWSVGNENADSDARLSFMSRLAAKAKQEDPGRLVCAACLVNKAKLRIEDRLAAYLDVIGLNEYYGWYDPNYEELVQIGRNSHPDKPIIISETGADALAGHHGSRDELFTEEYMAEVYHKQLAILSQLDYVQGLTPWILYDFRSPRRQNRYQQGFNRKGLIALDKRTKKAAFQVLQEFYRAKAAEERG